MAPIVFAFKGRAYQGRPGTERCVLEVREDFGEWRKATSDNGEAIAKWLVAHGYRMCYRKDGRGETWDYEEWWVLTSLVGESGEVLPSRLRELLDIRKRANEMLAQVNAAHEREIRALEAEGMARHDAIEEWKYRHYGS